MPLVRAWTRGLWGASGAAVLAPGAIFIALLLLAVAGSFGRLGGLGQAFSGPAAPGSGPAASALVAPPPHGGSLLRTASTAAASRPGLASTPTGASPGVAGTAHAAPPANRPPGVTVIGEHPPPPYTHGSSGCGNSCSSPASSPTLIDDVVSVGTSVTSKLPGAVGQLATQLLGQLGATVDRVLPTDRHAGVVATLGSTLSALKLP